MNTFLVLLRTGVDISMMLFVFYMLFMFAGLFVLVPAILAYATLVYITEWVIEEEDLM